MLFRIKIIVGLGLKDSDVKRIALSKKRDAACRVS